MTAKRDLKRRVRLRQARTGESYVTARRRVMAARTAADDLLKGDAKTDDEESADDEPTVGREPLDQRDVAVASGGADATLPGVPPDDDADATLPGVSDEDDAQKGAGPSAAASAAQEARAGVGADEGALGSAAASADEDARGGAAAMAASTEEVARARAAARASAEEKVWAAALTSDSAAHAIMARPIGPATAAALMEAVEISAAMTMARADGNTEVQPPARPSTTGAEVIELREVTAEAALLGFRCRITVFPSVLEGAELATVLLALRNALVGPGGSTGQARMFDVAFGLPSKPAPLMVRAYPPTAMLAFEVAGRGGPFDVACRLWYPASTLILRRADDLELRGVTVTRASHTEPDEPHSADPIAARIEREVLAQLAQVTRLHHPPLPALYIVDGPRRHRVTHDSFVIGRGGKSADLVIKDGMISRKHAAVIYRNGRYYLKDLRSVHGIRFRGMLIDNKRIDEGDVFVLGDHELRFTYREDG